MLGGMAKMAFDTAGRITLPETLCAQLELSESDWVTVVGMGERFQIWPRDAFQAHRAEQLRIARLGLPALRARLSSLRGTPIVINKWASWFEACRAEFGIFQRVSVSRGRAVAFIGIDSGESSRANALAFLRAFPVSYPSYYDHSEQMGTAITDSTFTPVTVFYNRHGALFIHQGPYPSVAKLERDVARYALEA